MRDLGLIDEVRLGEDHYHYEIKAPAYHHHLICLGCSQVLEFASSLAEELAAAVARRHGFEIREIRIDLTGYCANCRQRSGLSGLPQLPSQAANLGD